MKLNDTKMLESMANHSPTGLWMSDEAGYITFLNQTLIDLIGKPAESILGAGWAEAIYEEDRQGVIDNFQKAISAKQRYQAEFRLADPEGNLFWVHSAGEPFFTKDQVYAGFTGYCMNIHEQKTLGERITQEKKALLTMFEDSPVGIAMLDKKDLTFIMANRFYLQLVGRNHEELINKPLLEALPELKGQGFDKLLEDVIATGEAYHANEVSVDLLVNGNIETKYVDLTYQPRTDNKQVIGVLVVATDVTQQVLARRKTELSEARLKGLIAAAPAGIGLFVGRDLVIEYPNQTFIDIVGKGPGVEGLPLREAMPELTTEGQPFLKILDDVFTTGKMFQSFGAQVQIVQDGVMTYNYYNITYTPVYDNKGEVYAILDIAIDVTEQVLAQQKLEEKEKELSGAVQLAGLANWSYDISSEVFSYSPEFMKWLGLTEDNLDAVAAYEPVPVGMREIVMQKISDAISSESGIYNFEHSIFNTQTGEERVIHAQAQVFYDQDNKPVVLKGTAQDVTQRKNIEITLGRLVKERTLELANANKELSTANEDLGLLNNQLLASNVELAQYAYVVSHDLQEPLRKIQVFSDQLLSDQSLAADQKKLCTKIFDAAGRMTGLISDLLDFSRIQQANEAKEDVDLSDVVDKVKLDFEVAITEKQAVITYGSLPVIRAVQVQMHQLFYNLVGNALKFVQANTHPVVHIKCSVVKVALQVGESQPALTPGDYFKIEISDNGIGLNAKYFEKIFDVFKRLHTKKDYAGSGIGLALCKKIVEKHDGSIYVESNGTAGSTFVVMLPAYQD